MAVLTRLRQTDGCEDAVIACGIKTGLKTFPAEQGVLVNDLRDHRLHIFLVQIQLFHVQHSQTRDFKLCWELSCIILLCSGPATSAFPSPAASNTLSVCHRNTVCHFCPQTRPGASSSAQEHLPAQPSQPTTTVCGFFFFFHNTRWEPEGQQHRL